MNIIEDNEPIYDEQIAPLMAQIIAICKQRKIPMVASFEYAPESFCTTALPFEGQSDYISQLNRVAAKAQPRSSLMLTVRDADGNVTAMEAIL